MHGAPLFSQLMGFSDIRCLKTESEYWLRALARTGWAAHQVVVVGDNYQDDFLIPRLAGIGRFVLHLPDEAAPTANDTEVHVITEFAQI
jgi:FMN phosphatase YigB (HAD superfamily)